MPMSLTLANAVLDSVCKGTAFITPVTGYVGLLTELVGIYDTAGTVTEVANAGAYARVQLPAMSSGAFRANHNTAILQFATASADWTTMPVVAWGLFSSGTYGAGSLLWYENICPLSVHKNDPKLTLPVRGFGLNIDLTDFEG